MLMLSQILKGPYLFHGPTGLRLHLVQQKGWPFSTRVLNLLFTGTSRRPTFYLIRYVIKNDDEMYAFIFV